MATEALFDPKITQYLNVKLVQAPVESNRVFRYLHMKHKGVLMLGRSLQRRGILGWMATVATGSIAFGLGLGIGSGNLPSAFAQPDNDTATSNAAVTMNVDRSAPPGAQKYKPANITFPGNDGASHRITWDKNSFMIDGKRINIWSGEVHPWRIPDVEGWRDILQKMRANGYNAVSFYLFWGMHQTEENGPFDFTPGTVKDLDLLLRIASEEGIYVILRPGPYVNAEISMGGLPAYMTNFSGQLRSTDPQALRASKAWLHAVNQIAKRHLVTDGGGSVIMYQVENELYNESQKNRDFLRELANYVRNDGITVPLFHNDWGMGGRFANHNQYGLDFYAYDRYPVGFNCSANRNRIEDSESSFRNIAPDTPHFITESQGGAFTPWGATYNASDCYRYTDPAFTRQWAVNNIGNGVSAFNFYMAFGGTNWGWTGSPSSGFTSYDYGAGITEDRIMTPKASVQKEIGYYSKAVPELPAMDPVQAPRALEHTGAAVNIYQRQANTGTGSVTGHGTRSIALRLNNSNDETETKLAIPLVLSEGVVATENGFSHDDRSSQISYTGNWQQVADLSASKGTVTRSANPGDSATLNFFGTGVKLYVATGTDHGHFTVSVDGGDPTTVTTAHLESDQNKPSQFEAFSVADLPAGQHTIVVTNSGNQGQFLDIDAFDVAGSDQAAGTLVNNADSNFFTFHGGGWLHENRSWTQGDINQDESYSNRSGDYYEFTFTGVGFDIIAPYSENHAAGSVTVDGTEVGRTVEEVSAGAQPQKVIFSWRSQSSEPAEHTVRVTNTGQRFPGSSGTFMPLDAVRYYANASELPLPESSDTDIPEGTVGWARIPQQEGTFLNLHGRDALLLTADIQVGGVDMYYTTSQLFGAPLETAMGKIQYLVGQAGDPGETVLRFDSEPTVTAPTGVTSVWDNNTGQLRINYTHTNQPVNIKVTAGDKTLTLRVIDREFAIKTWMIDGMRNGHIVTAAVEGAEIARTAHYDGSAIEITGSNANATAVRVLAPSGVDAVTWNGESISAQDSYFEGNVRGPIDIPLQTLQFKKLVDTPEAEVGFDDSNWRAANDTTVANPGAGKQGPAGWQGVAIDSNHYGFYEGSVWYRARYTASKDNPTLTIRGNAGSGQPGQGKTPGFMQVWINGQYAGALPADGNNHRIAAPQGVVRAGEPVVLAIVVHNLGQNLDWSDNGLSKQNRGLGDVNLDSNGAQAQWKIHGATTATVNNTAINPSGTLYNTGGLNGELAGYMMPNFDDSNWESTSDLHSPVGITWYRAHAKLNVPANQDSQFRLDINSSRFASLTSAQENRSDAGDRSQVILFVNGWNTGVYIGDKGPQTSFTIPSAFLNMNGDNVITAVVAAKREGMGPESITLRAIHSTTKPGAAEIPSDPEPEPTDNTVTPGVDSGSGDPVGPVVVPTTPANPSDSGDSGTTPGIMPGTPGGSGNTDGSGLIVERWSGSDRVATSLATWKNTKGAELYLAGYDGLPDALTGSVPAALSGTSVVYTYRDKLPQSLVEALANRRITTATILGGTQVVSEAVADQLRDLGISVSRLSGRDRYETARSVAQRVALLRSGATDTGASVVLADGVKLADALVAAPLAVERGAAVLLTRQDVLPEASKGLLTANTEVVAVGGPAARALRSGLIGFSAASFVVGSDRFETSVMVANKYFADAKLVGVANGDAPADAVVGASYMASNHSPLLLTKTDSISIAAKERLKRANRVIIFGGTTRITNRLEQDISLLK